MTDLENMAKDLQRRCEEDLKRLQEQDLPLSEGLKLLEEGTFKAVKDVFGDLIVKEREDGQTIKTVK